MTTIFWIPFAPKELSVCLPIYKQMACVDTIEITQLKTRNTDTTLASR